MKIIEPSFEILDEIDGKEIIRKLERAGRICYKSEDRIKDDSAEKFVGRRIAEGHEAIIEHEKITVKIICDRGVTHELVRHRIASFSQESTRYCNYANDKFGNEITLIRPYFWEEDSQQYEIWKKAMYAIESAYMNLISSGATPQEARAILPNSLKTEIIVTMNMRQWRHFFKLRCDKSAHPQMRQITRPMLEKFRELIPVVFDDITKIT